MAVLSTGEILLWLSLLFAVPNKRVDWELRIEEIWNKAMVGRLVDWVVAKKESIWVKWVNANYLKRRDWQEYTASSNSSWVWRRICRVKQELSAGYNQGKWNLQPEGYTPAGCYEWLRGSRPKVDWYGLVWDTWNLPKHRLMGWFMAHNSLHTNSKLLGFGLDIDDSCYLCGLAAETQHHLFFECEFSKQALHLVNQGTGFSIHDSNVLDWCAHRPGSKVQKGVQNAMVMGTIYQLWQQRNRCRVEKVLQRPTIVAQMLLEELRKRIRERDKSLMKCHDI
ncbi:uncharacterized protein LOC141618837 [Silene latifolia]|uniref:uncharacterized protein LOC141618837 n=1 Tax=Silene latifolia TaxID=37657 RepID=UPI003D781F1D